jgi:hypothetical protein
MTALGEAVISGSAFGGRPTTPASPRSAPDHRSCSLQYDDTATQTSQGRGRPDYPSRTLSVPG